ncbi:MAG: peroxiredoxin [Phycisphaeraceae bacterium]|nr:peroxiredoxin [Phycisphaeraceae bacterium]
MSRRMAWVVSVAGVAASASAQDYRSIDGSGNNLGNLPLGSAGQTLLREASGAHYADGLGTMIDRGNPRVISNALSVQTGSGNDRNLSSMFWQWGQFIDHDIAMVPGGTEFVPILTPPDDPYFFGGIIPFVRSSYVDGDTSPRQHPNAITHWLDGSMVYGSDDFRADWLREGDGGRLKMTADGFMPRNTDGLANANDGPLPDEQMFVAGDVRSNEQSGLTAMHTLFVREHNRWAERLGEDNPGWGDEQIYQTARKIVGAEIQKITYDDWLPSLLGGHGVGSYAGYNDQADPTQSSAFTTAAFRFGHTMLNEQLLRKHADGSDFAGGHLNLMEAFFQPELIVDAGSLDAIVCGLVLQQAEELDTQAVDAVRNFLFGPPGAGGLDLISLNLQRGRDHGVADYNTMREDFGLDRVDTFSDITSDSDLAAALEAAYGSVDNIDPWMGIMAEDHLAGASAGETLAAILRDQFTRLRDADRFFYLNDEALLPYLDELSELTLGQIISLNTDIGELQRNVFMVPAPSGLLALAGVGLIARRRRR